jgi:acetoin utilization deacetylase AcuC-like enzyme
MLVAGVILPAAALQLTIVESTLHARHRPPPGVRHVEVPDRLTAAADALRAARFSGETIWRRAVDGESSPEDAVVALKRVHTIEHLRSIQAMSQTGGGGFDTDTYW